MANGISVVQATINEIKQARQHIEQAQALLNQAAQEVAALGGGAAATADVTEEQFEALCPSSVANKSARQAWYDAISAAGTLAGDAIFAGAKTNLYDLG